MNRHGPGRRCEVCDAECALDCARDWLIEHGKAPTRERERALYEERLAAWRASTGEQEVLL